MNHHEVVDGIELDDDMLTKADIQDDISDTILIRLKRAKKAVAAGVAGIISMVVYLLTGQPVSPEVMMSIETIILTGIVYSVRNE